MQRTSTRAAMATCMGKNLVEKTTECVRREAERCDSLQAIFTFRSFGGGTGSGFTTLLLQNLDEDFRKKVKFEFSIYPSPRVSAAVVEPYNTVLTTSNLLDICDMTFMMDNEALYEICHHLLDIEQPSYAQMNSVISQVVSSVTSSLRFQGSFNVDLKEFMTNLVPYPRFHFPLVSYAPIVSAERAHSERFNVRKITRACFEPTNQMVKCDPRKGKYFACCLLYRGDVTPNDARDAVRDIKTNSSLPFVKWSANGFKLGINIHHPIKFEGGHMANVARRVDNFSNHTAIVQAWANVNRKFDLMFRKKAFFHFYVSEGMHEAEFEEAHRNLAALEIDYEEALKE